MHNENFVYLTFEDTILDSGHCLLDLLEFPNDNKTPAISFNHLLEHKRCEISRNDQSKYQMPLLHSLTCPARIFARENHIVLRLERPIRLAGCAIITSSDSKVLMTRRTENLRIFPKSWVFPGGRLEPNETLESCAIREAKEETGIDFQIIGEEFLYQNQSISVNPLFLYESFYPSVGIPQAQHLVAFFTINLNKLANEVELNLQRSEVDYAVWISKTDYEHILLRLEGQTPGIHFLNEVSPINYSQLFDLAPNSLGEGIAEGHKLALDIIFG